MNLSTLRRAALLPSALALLLAAAACAPSTPDEPGPSESAPDSHGIDAGSAAEVASPALALVTADAQGELTLLDLDTEERAVLAPGRAEAVFGDGRLVYRAHHTGAHTEVEVFDTARWTVPHGDHTHSFRGEPHLVGTLTGQGAVAVARGEQRATLGFDGGEVIVLAHDELDAGLDDAPRMPVDAAGPVVSFAGHLLVPAAASIAIIGPGGATVAGAEVPCDGASDADVTRVGVVFTCADGAALFTREVGGAVTGESIPLPAEAEGATELSGRADRPDLAGVAGDQGAWLLDVRARRWGLIPSDVPLVRAVALGDDANRTVALDAEGRVRVLAPDGTVIARTEPLLAASLHDPALRDRVHLIADAQHAYVSDPATGSVHEIDHGDGRLTRTFPDLDPWFLQQVG
ncbi:MULTISPECIES: hypothetical protein [unclassified Microbacterium]|uniref:hypothetical protein n=1 Tax=unclassified Microbacterium TaxID=2609290 RepID=UPI00301643AB